MTIGAAIGKADHDWRSAQRHWHRVGSGLIFGTRTWFSDGYERRVWNEQIWRCGYYAWGSWEDGPSWTYCYAYDEKAWIIALENRYPLDSSENKLDNMSRSPL